MQLLGLGRVFSWLDLPLAFLPRILVGVLIIAAGHVLGVLRGVCLGDFPGPSAKVSCCPD
jgi:hypothetical protein